MYLLAVGYYRSGEYSKGMDLVNACFEIVPRCWKTSSLKNLLQYGMKKDRIKGRIIAATTTLSLISCVFAATPLFSYPSWCIEAIRIKNLIKDHVKEVPSLPSTSNPLQKNEELYILAHRYYMRGDYSRSKRLVDCCLEIAPESRPAITLKTLIEYHIKKDEVIVMCIGVALTTVGMLASALLSPKK